MSEAWSMKCNHCGVHFQYQETDTWLDHGGPVHCEEHADYGTEDEAFFMWLCDFAPIAGTHLSPGEVTQERKDRFIKTFERKTNWARKYAQ